MAKGYQGMKRAHERMTQAEKDRAIINAQMKGGKAAVLKLKAKWRKEAADDTKRLRKGETGFDPITQERNIGSKRDTGVSRTKENIDRGRTAALNTLLVAIPGSTAFKVAGLGAKIFKTKAAAMKAARDAVTKGKISPRAVYNAKKVVKKAGDKLKPKAAKPKVDKPKVDKPKVDKPKVPKQKVLKPNVKVPSKLKNVGPTSPRKPLKSKPLKSKPLKSKPLKRVIAETPKVARLSRSDSSSSPRPPSQKPQPPAQTGKTPKRLKPPAQTGKTPKRLKPPAIKKLPGSSLRPFNKPPIISRGSRTSPTTVKPQPLKPPAKTSPPPGRRSGPPKPPAKTPPPPGRRSGPPPKKGGGLKAPSPVRVIPAITGSPSIDFDTDLSPSGVTKKPKYSRAKDEVFDTDLVSSRKPSSDIDDDFFDTPSGVTKKTKTKKTKKDPHWREIKKASKALGLKYMVPRVDEHGDELPPEMRDVSGGYTGGQVKKLKKKTASKPKRKTSSTRKRKGFSGRGQGAALRGF
jgi:hypothetical protein